MRYKYFMPNLNKCWIKISKSTHLLILTPCLTVVIIFGLAQVIARHSTSHPTSYHQTSQKTQHVAPSESTVATEQQNTTTSTSSSSVPQTNAEKSSESQDTTPKPYGTPPSGTQSSPVTTQPKGNPAFRLVLSPPGAVNNPFGFAITIVPSPSPVSYNYTMPKVVSAPNGLPCNSWNNEIYNIGNDRLTWGWSCNIFSGASYGSYPVTFSSTATGGYGETATETITGTVVYHADQTTYDNIF